MTEDAKVPSVSNSSVNTVHYTARLLARNTVFNLMGYILPMAVALVAIPYLIKGLGIERFGVLTLAWMVLIYFNLFDMGIGRATTKFVAEYMAIGKSEKIVSLVGISLLLLSTFGILGGGILAILTPWLINSVLNIPAYLVNESLNAFWLLSLSIPFSLMISGTRGVLEAQQRFALINAIKIPAYSATFVLPLLVLPFTSSLYPIVAVLVASRCLVLILYLYFSMKSLPKLTSFSMPSSHIVKSLLKYGGWLTISNVISPVMVFMDRILIGAVLTMSAVTFYVTPYELITKLTIIAGSLMGVMFPVFSSYAKVEINQLHILFHRSTKYLFLIITPIIMSIIVFSEQFLDLWLGPEFAVESTRVLQLLAIGVLINSMAHVPYGTIQALGHPDWTAKLHLIELPIYLVLLWFLTKSYGITGTAIAWILRATIDAVALFLLSRKLIVAQRGHREFPIMKTVLTIVIVLGLSFLISNLDGILLKVGFLLFILSLTVTYTWKYMFEGIERSYIRKMTGSLIRLLTFLQQFIIKIINGLFR